MLKLKDVHTYRAAVYVLKGINLEVNPGEIVGILGANGAGKSTLLGTIIGAYKPRQGEIWWREQQITGCPPEKLVARGISLVPEQREIFSALSVYDNLLLGAYTQYFRQRKQLPQRVDGVIQLFPRLKVKMNQLAGTLSGGEQQMLAIGRALMAAPEIILMDEPSIGLAPVVVEEIAKSLVKMRSAAQTILLVEQNVTMAIDLCDRIYVMDRGAIVFHGPPEVLKREEKLLVNSLI